MEKDRHAGFDEFMGDKFKSEPKILVSELECSIKSTSNSLKRLHELRAPETIINAYQERLGELLTDLKDGNYAITESDIMYATDYNERVQEYISLCNDDDEQQQHRE